LQTSVGVIRFGMSVGVHTGEIDFLLVGSHHRELIVTGPAATTKTQMEKLAERGQIVISPATAAILPQNCAGAGHHTGFLLASAARTSCSSMRAPKRSSTPSGSSSTRCGAARTAEEMSLWSEERNRLVEQLGIVLQTAERPGRAGDASVNAALPSRNG
jgi:hypothetical protein